jgi:excisionase family DNA binding protein
MTTVIRRTVKIDEAAAILGISRNGAYNAAKDGSLPTIRIGKRLLVPIAALDRLLGSADHLKALA